MPDTPLSPTPPTIPPDQMRLQALKRSIIFLLGVVLLVGGLFYWLQMRETTQVAARKEQTKAHVILKPSEESQDWRLKEGIRVEELATIIDKQRRQMTDLESQVEAMKTLMKKQDKGQTKLDMGETSPRSRQQAVPPLPPLSQILPQPDPKQRPPTRTPALSPRPQSTEEPADTQGDARALTPSTPTSPAPPPRSGPQPPTLAKSSPTSSTPSTPPSPTSQRQDQGQGFLRTITPRAQRRDTVKPLQSMGWLPSGSFVRAQLLSGIDAGTGTGSNLPLPVLMRLTDLGILPNRFQMDITECFVIGAAWGDLPSERVYIRTETLSCLHKAGNIVTIDGDLKAQAIGEDGKLGLHGRVVTKQGAILANSMMAGFISGLSQAFKPRISYAPLTLTGNSTDNRSFELPPLQDSLTAAGVSGVGRTTELIAGFYLKQAQSLFPVIEIDSARHVDLVILKGMPLKFNVQRTAAGTIAQDTID